jgi:hypothetical protein
LGPDRRSQSESAIVHERDGLFIRGHLHDAESV